VNEFLKDGYELYGSPFCSADRYCQAIVKYDGSGNGRVHFSQNLCH